MDESIPGSQNEDWDLALRAARRHPIVHVDTPLVRVAWHASSHYAQQWQTRADSLLWMLEHHPELADSRPGAARVYAQLVVRLRVPAAAGGRVPVGVAGGAAATGTSAGSRSRWRSRRAWCRGRRCCGT